MKSAASNVARKPRPTPEPAWIGPGICDGCLQQKPQLRVVNAAPVLAGACLCQDCLTTPTEACR